MQDWIQDLKFSYTVPIDDQDCPGCEVHQGFNENYSALKEQILLALAADDVSGGLEITGHSLGGAMAAIAAWDLVRFVSAGACGLACADRFRPCVVASLLFCCR